MAETGRDARFKFLYPLWLKSHCPSCPVHEARESRREKISLLVSQLCSGTLLTEQSSKQTPLSSTLSCLYLLPVEHSQSYRSSISPQNSAPRVFCQGASSGCLSGLGNPNELWILFCSLGIEQIEGKDSFLFLLLFFLCPQHKASCRSHSKNI